jgi:hypothetical protein
MYRRLMLSAMTILSGLALTLGISVAASAAPSLPPGGCIALPANAVGFQVPIRGGLALDALNWGGGGTKSAACTGAQVNNPIGVWKTNGASIAADFTKIPVTGLTAPEQALCTANGATGCFLLEYTPANLQSGLCVSTVIDRQGSFFRLRGCAPSAQGSGDNQWQDFAFVPTGDGFNEITAVLEPGPGPFVANDTAWGGNGTQVISWPPISSSLTPCTTSHGCENQIWEQVTAP